MFTTDVLQLNKTQMFEEMRAGLGSGNLQTQNLLECKDDLLMAWEAKQAYLLVLNWRAAHLQGFDKVSHQILIPSTPQNFHVERVLSSNEASLVAVAGPRGVAILELPRRWGKYGQFMDGKTKITCRTTNLSSRLFSNNPNLEVRQIRWHPASPTDSHLLVLLNDNSLRVYDNTNLRHVWQVGPVPLNTLGLGEDIADFDFAPAVTVRDFNTTTKLDDSVREQNKNNSTLNETKHEKLNERIEWPIVLLRENGNIYILMAGLDSDKVRLQGPITISPQTDDNYGVDSCSILVIPSLPPSLVIAESSGKLHHALLLESETLQDESYNEVDNTLMIYPCEWSIHVLETVELELGLTKQQDKERGYNCPIHLQRDLINELRYFAYHNAGLHVVSVNFINEIQRYLENDANVDDLTLTTSSRAEYLICTKVKSSEFGNSVLGFVLLQMPTGLVLLLGSGEVISLKLIIDPQLLTKTCSTIDSNGNNPRDDKSKENESTQEPDFVDHIKNMLKRTVTQPILSLDKSHALTPQESYELLKQAIEVLRTEYLERHKLIRAEFAKRINTIIMRKEQQHSDIVELEREREEIREKAHHLAEQFEEISDKQELLTKKCQNLVREAHIRFPTNAVADVDFATDVERVNKATKNMQVSLQKARDTINKQCYHIAKYNETYQEKTFELPEKKEQAIKEIILQMSTEIDGQIKQIKTMNKVVGN